MYMRWCVAGLANRCVHTLLIPHTVCLSHWQHSSSCKPIQSRAAAELHALCSASTILPCRCASSAMRYKLDTSDSLAWMCTTRYASSSSSQRTNTHGLLAASRPMHVVACILIYHEAPGGF